MNVLEDKSTPEENFREYIKRTKVPFKDAIQMAQYINVGLSYGLTEGEIRGLKEEKT